MGIARRDRSPGAGRGSDSARLHGPAVRYEGKERNRAETPIYVCKVGGCPFGSSASVSARSTSLTTWSDDRIDHEPMPERASPMATEQTPRDALLVDAVRRA
jgi:hypothetical protein